MTIYISGKVTGTDDYEKRFSMVESRLKLQGWHVINPVKKCKNLPKGSKWEVYMKKCIRLLTRCDAIYLMRGWRQSKGAVIEQRLAVDLGLTIISEEKGE